MMVTRMTIEVETMRIEVEIRAGIGRERETRVGKGTWVESRAGIGRVVEIGRERGIGRGRVGGTGREIVAGIGRERGRAADRGETTTDAMTDTLVGEGHLPTHKGQSRSNLL